MSGRYASSPAEGAEGQLWPIGSADSTGKDRMLVALTEMAELLVSQDDPRLTPARLLKFAVEHLGFVDAGVLLTEDPEHGDLRIEASEGHDVSGLESAFMVASEISSGGSIERDEAEPTSQPEALLQSLTNKLSGDGGPEEASCFPIEDGAEAVVMPLFFEGRMAGAMLLRPVSGRGLLAQEDATFLRVMAEILARSIESSRRVRGARPDRFEFDGGILPLCHTGDASVSGPQHGSRPFGEVRLHSRATATPQRVPR